MAWSSVLETAGPKAHVVQFYGEDDRFFIRNVCRYLSEGLKRREGILIIASPEHARAFVAHLTNTDSYALRALEDGRLVFRDAQATLDQIIVAGAPDQQRFDAVIGTALREVQSRTGHRRVRAYGEMVGLLWTVGSVAAAIRLEECWNELLESQDCSLFCGYPIDVFGPEFQTAAVDSIMCAHSHFIPADPDFESAIDFAIGDIMGRRADSVRLLLRSAMLSWEGIPKVEVMALWLRRNLPEHADTILERARGHVAASAGSPPAEPSLPVQ